MEELETVARISAMGIKDYGYTDRFGQFVNHCVDGPAILFPNGAEHYFLYDKRHCLTGYAVVDPNNETLCAWFVDDKKLSSEEAFLEARDAYVRDNPECPSVVHYWSRSGRRVKSAAKA